MSLWGRFTHWVVSDMLTLEERELIAQEARRLRLRTDLQEKRIKERETRNMTFFMVGTWTVEHRCQHQNKWTDARATFYLEERIDRQYRRVRAGPVAKMDDGMVISRGELSEFFKNRPLYLSHIAQWLQGSMTTNDLRKVNHSINITLPKGSKRS